MNKKLLTVLFVLIFSALVLTACGGGAQNAAQGNEKEGAGEDTGEPAEGQAPAPYAGKTNPDAGNADAAAKGKTIFEANCVSCHGADAKGTGPAGASLSPKPADLTQVGKEDKADFIFFRISEGGQMAPYNSAMPSFKDTLSEDERWQVVTYLQSFK